MNKEDEFCFALQKFKWHFGPKGFIINEEGLCPLAAVTKQPNNLNFLKAGRLFGFCGVESTAIAKAASNAANNELSKYWREKLLEYCGLQEN